MKIYYTSFVSYIYLLQLDDMIVQSTNNSISWLNGWASAWKIKSLGFDSCLSYTIINAIFRFNKTPCNDCRNQIK